MFGLFPANRVGDDIEFYTDESRTTPMMDGTACASSIERPSGKPHWCLADFIAPKDSGVKRLV